MKKNILSLTLIIIILVGTMFALTGCGSKMSSKNDVEEYLSKNYSNESFTILSQEKVDEVPVFGNGNGSHSGYKYIVKSNDTDIEFITEDTYEYTSYGTGDYGMEDSYRKSAMTKYIEDFGDFRISIYREEDFSTESADIMINLDDFSSIEEMTNILYNFKAFYESKKPFKDNYNYSINICIYENTNLKGFVYLSEKSKEISESLLKSNISSVLEN